MQTIVEEDRNQLTKKTSTTTILIIYSNILLMKYNIILIWGSSTNKFL